MTTSSQLYDRVCFWETEFKHVRVVMFEAQKKNISKTTETVTGCYLFLFCSDIGILSTMTHDDMIIIRARFISCD